MTFLGITFLTVKQKQQSIIKGYLLKCPWGDDQAIDHVDGNEDDGGGSYAVTHNCGPVGIIIIKKPQLGRVGQKAASDELKEKKG